MKTSKSGKPVKPWDGAAANFSSRARNHYLSEATPVVRFGLAVAAVVLAAIGRFLLNPWLGDTFPFFAFLLAVTVAAWYGGIGPALLATLLSMPIAWMLFVPPRFSLEFHQNSDFVGLAVFLIVSLVIAAFNGNLRAAWRRSAETERLIGEQAERLRTTLASIGDAVIASDIQGRITNFNAVAELLTGWTAEEATGKPIDDVLHIVDANSRQPIENSMQKESREGVAIRLANPAVLVAKNGTERLVEDSAAPIRTQEGKLVGSVLVLRDITERTEAEEQVRRSERELGDFFDNATVGIHWVGPDGIILRTNRAELNLLGYTAEEYIGHPITAFHADEDVIGDILHRLKAGEQLHDYSARLRCKDGSIRHVLISSNVLWENGEFIHTRCFTRDVTDRMQAELQLRQSEERYRSLVEQIKEHAIFRLDIVGQAATWNKGVQEVLGFEKSEFIGKEIGQLIFTAEDFREGIPQQELQIASEKGSASNDRWMKKKDGTRFWAAGITNALRDDRGNLVGFSMVMRDQTELKLMEEQLRLLARDLSEAALRKDEFLATLAHELRNPLAPVRNALQVFRIKSPDIPEVRWGCDVIERQLSHLTRLIDDLLDINRITRNRLELRKQRVELSEIIQGAVETSRPVIEQYSHELTVCLPSEPVYLNADLVRLAQVFMNLLTNAAKYTERQGRIWLTAKRENGETVVTVKDSGIGIPPDKLPRLFEMFFQVDRSLERSQGGLGIGLSLVRRLVELHGGTVEARSEGQHRGSEFIVRLPVLEEQPKRQNSSNNSGQAAVTTGRRMVVVDDNEDSAESLAMLLRLSGNEVHTANDGLAGVELVERIRPDIVLLDIGMPKLNGYEACRRIRQQPWGKSMVMIALTGWGQEEDRRTTEEVGFNAHLVKPIDHDVLLKLLAESC